MVSYEATETAWAIRRPCCAGFAHNVWEFTLWRLRHAAPQYKPFWQRMFDQAGMNLAAFTRKNATLH